MWPSSSTSPMPVHRSSSAVRVIAFFVIFVSSVGSLHSQRNRTSSAKRLGFLNSEREEGSFLVLSREWRGEMNDGLLSFTPFKRKTQIFFKILFYFFLSFFYFIHPFSKS